MNNDLNNSIHSEESARENLGAGDRLRVENGSGENHDVRGADEMVDQRAPQGVDLGQGEQAGNDIVMSPERVSALYDMISAGFLIGGHFSSFLVLCDLRLNW